MGIRRTQPLRASSGSTGTSVPAADLVGPRDEDDRLSWRQIRSSTGQFAGDLVGAVARFFRYLVDRAHALPAPVITVLIAIAMAICAFGGYTAWFVYDILRSVPSRASLEALSVTPQANILYDASDAPIFSIASEQRIDVSLAEVSPHLIQAVIAIEDRRFFAHDGVDQLRIISSMFANLRAGRAIQGASTITQQLARQDLGREKTVRRKLKEVAAAVQLERLYSKEEILERYLNKVYFGDGLYGAEAASRGYFGKSAADLTVAEAALLAGLVKAPSTYAPTVDLDRAIARRAVVLQAMVETGAITDNERDQAAESDVLLVDALHRNDASGQYVKEEVRRELVDRFGWDRVSRGGLQVYTTIDPGMQRAAEAAVEEHLKAIEARRPKRLRRAGPEPDTVGSSARLQGALIALDPTTLSVRAMVGGRDFAESSFNRAVQARRQPGSAFKPFLYAAALESGFVPEDLITALDEPVETAEGEWFPEDEHLEESEMTLRAALRTSSNRAAVRLLEEVGISKTTRYAKALGLGDMPPVPSVVLGSGEVTLETLTAAYGAFANGGLVGRPSLVRQVTDRGGQVLFAQDEELTRAIRPATAYLMADMLSDVVKYGTGYTVRRAGFTLPSGGKTGTTNDFKDAWFVGFTPNLVAGVWIGFDRPETILPNGYAGELAAPLWAQFMKSATRNDKAAWFAPTREVSAEIAAARANRVVASLSSTGALEPIPVSGDVPLLTATGRDETQATEQAGPPKKKRGFWARLFGVGRSDRRDEEKRDRRSSSRSNRNQEDPR